MKQFVYIDGLRGPEPQIWHDVHGKVKPLKSFQLDNLEAQMSIHDLMEKYPYDETSKS